MTCLGGRSPRVRGNHNAGRDAPGSSRVYPRECGGTRREVDDCLNYYGPIPASAGEPAGGLSEISSASVYPRECGGTVMSVPSGQGHVGVYPRECGGTNYINAGPIL